MRGSLPVSIAETRLAMIDKMAKQLFPANLFRILHRPYTTIYSHICTIEGHSGPPPLH